MFADENRQVLLLRSLGFVGVIALWESSSQLALINPKYLPPFSSTVTYIFELFRDTSFIQALQVTLIELIFAYLLAVILGVSVGLLAGLNSWLFAILNPVISGLFSTPKIVLLPFFMLLFGIDIPQKIYFGAFHGMWVVAINVLAGTRQVDEDLIRASRAMGGNVWQIWTKLYLPSMTPLLFVGLRSGMIFTFLGVILAEMSVSKRGLGRLIVAAGDTGNMTMMLAVVLLIATVSIFINGILLRYQERLFHWKE